MQRSDAKVWPAGLLLVACSHDTKVKGQAVMPWASAGMQLTKYVEKPARQSRETLVQELDPALADLSGVNLRLVVSVAGGHPGGVRRH